MLATIPPVSFLRRDLQSLNTGSSDFLTVSPHHDPEYPERHPLFSRWPASHTRIADTSSPLPSVPSSLQSIPPSSSISLPSVPPSSSVSLSLVSPLSPVSLLYVHPCSALQSPSPQSLSSPSLPSPSLSSLSLSSPSPFSSEFNDTTITPTIAVHPPPSDSNLARDISSHP